MLEVLLEAQPNSRIGPGRRRLTVECFSKRGLDNADSELARSNLHLGTSEKGKRDVLARDLVPVLSKTTALLPKLANRRNICATVRAALSIADPRVRPCAPPLKSVCPIALFCPMLLHVCCGSCCCFLLWWLLLRFLCVCG